MVFHLSINRSSAIPVTQQMVECIQRAIQEQKIHHLDLFPQASEFKQLFNLTQEEIAQIHQTLETLNLLRVDKNGAKRIHLRPKVTLDYFLYTKPNAKKLKSARVLYLGESLSSEPLRLQFHLRQPILLTIIKRLAKQSDYPILFETISILNPHQHMLSLSQVHKYSLPQLISRVSSEVIQEERMIYQPTIAIEEIAAALGIDVGDPLHTIRVIFYRGSNKIAIAEYHFPAEYVQLRRDD